MRHLYRMLLGLTGVRLCANSQAGALSYAHWLGLERVPVVPNGLADAAFAMPAGTAPDDPAGTAPDTDERRPVPDRPLILGAFRLSAEKRPDLFVEVIARLHARRPEARAMLCGSGALEAATRAHIAARGLEPVLILMPGNDTLPALMRGADLLLHVAEAEGTPNVLLEAQAVGLPVVCSAAPGTLGALAPSLHRYACPPGDVEALVTACLAVLDDPAAGRRDGLAAREHVLRHYTLAALAEGTLAAMFDTGARKA
jgi:glycosyltransferase involved in cell wall biosynthesis